MLKFKKNQIVKHINDSKQEYLVLKDANEEENEFLCVKINIESKMNILVQSSLLKLKSEEFIGTPKFLHETVCNRIIQNLCDKEESEDIFELINENIPKKYSNVMN